MSDILNMNFLPQETAFSRLMQEAKNFVAENGFRGDYITTGVVFAVLLKDQNVKKFISAQTGCSMAEMDHLSVAAEQNAISTIKGLQPQSSKIKIVEDDGSGMPEVRTLTLQPLPRDSSPQEIGLYCGWDKGFRSFYAENVDRLKTPLEILVAMAVSPQVGILGIESLDREFERFNLKNLHEDLLMQEYGPTSPYSIKYEGAKPSGRALAFAREFEAGDAHALSPRDHWYATNATQDGSREPTGENAKADERYSVQAVARALQNPVFVDALLANPEALDAIVSGIKRGMRTPDPKPRNDIDTKPSIPSLKAKAFRPTSGRRKR